jgi:hypothetical protein
LVPPPSQVPLRASATVSFVPGAADDLLEVVVGEVTLSRLTVVGGAVEAHRNS